MAVLTLQQRNTLETAVKQARRLAESGAINALRALAVDNPEPFSHMNPEQRSLRNRLRSKARLLGDELPSSGHQQIDHLAYELAYEYWHKILFAKFLEANGLLMHPDGVSVTMEECEELAKEAGYIDKWDTAGSFASKMLPAIFRPEDPLMQLSYAPNDRIKLEEIIDGLDDYIFSADDALGWVYQFWQSEAKEAINKSGDKIDGKKLPAVTQLFTEPYMVHFLIDNTLGAWWVSRNPGIKPPVNFEYLRLLDDGTPAAGKFEGWPDKTAEVTSLDPCMGSGHFVVSLFNVFTKLRMYEEGFTKEEATDKVIVENLHGLELDARCTQIAAFNLALTAWKFCGKYKELPEMNLACSGIAPKGKVDEWLKLVGKVNDPVQKARLENGIRALHEHFQLAPELGSLIDPTVIKPDAFTASFEDFIPILDKALKEEVDKDIIERGVIAAGIAKAGQLLSQRYILQITNVPYLVFHKQSDLLHEFCRKYYPESENDLATVFISRCLKSINKSGSLAIVSPQNWLYQTRYKAFRKKLLNSGSISFVSRLGSGAFGMITGEVVKITLSILNKGRINPESVQIKNIDVSNSKSMNEKIEQLKVSDIHITKANVYLKSKDSRIIIGYSDEDKLLNQFATILHGQSAGDNLLFNRFFWELQNFGYRWELYQNDPDYPAEFSGRSQIIMWEKENGTMARLAESVKHLNNKAQQWRSGKTNWGKKGVAVSLMGNIIGTLYRGEIYSQSCGVIIPNNEKYLGPIWMFIHSSNFEEKLRTIDPSLAVSIKTLLTVPFDLDYWENEYNKNYPTGLPKPYCEDPTQWLFHGHPKNSYNTLHVAIARLLGFRWPAENDVDMELSDEAKKLIIVLKSFDNYSDEDGIICIPSVNAEETGADRLRSYLRALYNEDWTNDTINQLLTKEEAKSSNLGNWLRNEFFIQHCKIFNNRPFIWQIWDGRNDGFSALVNYHKLNKENLSKLIYTYLGDWIRMCQAKKKSGESGTEGLLSAALKLKEKLELILEGESPYDIFVRWKPIEQQPIGWDPDLNDGVRLNIRPFIEADVLRKKPNIKWGIDRGKNPPGSPWGVVRDNDKHLTLAEKKEARERV